MTRLLVLGSSHVGALKRAEAEFKKRFPTIEIVFFGTPGASFLTGNVDESGVFSPGYGKDGKDRAFARVANGQETVDVSGFDATLIVGHRFDFGIVAELLSDHDVLQGVETGKPRQISEGFFIECMKDVTQQAVDVVVKRLGPDRNFTISMAPYPATSIEQRIGSLPFAKVVHDFSTHPDAPRLFKQWVTHLEGVLNEHGYRLLSQPADTLAGPFTTLAEFAKNPSDGNTGELRKPDHRHMNKDYGLRVLEDFATKHLKYQPVTA